MQFSFRGALTARKLVPTFLAGSLLYCIAGLWFMNLKAEARARMEAVYTRVSDHCGQIGSTDMTEAEVEDLIGWPGQVTHWPDETVRTTGGGMVAPRIVVKQWDNYGTVLWVGFNEAGVVRAAWITDPLPFIEKVRHWLRI